MVAESPAIEVAEIGATGLGSVAEAVDVAEEIGAEYLTILRRGTESAIGQEQRAADDDLIQMVPCVAVFISASDVVIAP